MNKVTNVAARVVRACLLAVAFAPVLCMAQPVPPNFTMPFTVWHKAVIAVPASTTGNTYYVDGTNGNNANTGTTSAAPFKTIAKALTKVAAGDTVLIKKGLYREGIIPPVTGTAAEPITFGSFGDGEVVLDGSKPVTGWTNVGGTVWQATATFTPIAVVVNEVPLNQVGEGQNGSTATGETAASVTSGSGKWHVNYSTKVITADFGTVIGSGNPNSADIIVPDDNGGAEFVFWYDVSYITFKGLTIRGNGSNGAWGIGGHITIDSCDIKFNGKSAVSFQAGSGLANTDNSFLYSHAYHNNLINWPRGNNGNAEAGGGWPGTVVWYANLRPLARGNVVHKNGGEGILSYGTDASVGTSGSALFEQNVIYDNWSVNLYFDNQPNDVARNNFIFNHPPQDSDYLHIGNTYPWNEQYKFTVCMMLADEENSSDGTSGFAALSGTTVYNNVLAGCRIGIRDYSEGTHAQANHGLKNTIIANNTIIMPVVSFLNSGTFGIYLQDNGSRNTGSVIKDNVVYGFNDDPVFFSEKNGVNAGIAIDYNDYFSASSTPFGTGSGSFNFSQWKATIGADSNSMFADPQLVDVTAFRGTQAAVPQYDVNNARLKGTSPAVGAGTPVSGAGTLPTDFLGTTRPNPPSIGAFEPSFFSTTTALTSSFNPSTQGQPVTFTATVSFPTATGGVTFKDGATTLCGGAVTVSSGVAACSVSTLSVGSHSITAQYGGDGTYGPSTSPTVTQVVTALPVSALRKLDFDGDGNEDLVFQDADGSIEIWLMAGTTVKLAGAKIIPTLPGHVMPSAGDFDGDGKADLLFQRLDGSVEMWLMDGTAVKSKAVIMPISQGWSVVGTGDFDADGKSDILWHNLDGTVGLWLMNGTAQKQRTSIIGAGAVSVPTHVGDFNGDGKSDIVWRSSYDGSVYVWLMNGLTPAERGPIMNGPTSWDVLQVGDFDGNGHDDLVWQNAADGTVSLWMMNGRTIVTKGPVMGANTNWTVTGTGDLNGDGNSDLFWLGRDGSVGTWLMNGLTIVNKKTQFAAGSGWTVGTVGDYDNDGKDDIVWTNVSGAVSIWLMNGLDFAAKTPLLPAGSTTRLVKVRFDH